MANSGYHVELISSGIKELLRSADMTRAMEDEAKKIAKRCGPGYATDTYTGRGRVNASVYADTKEAYLDNLDNNTLVKAIK